jgi:23S rRNA pseudouridine1911/1915/1917 synthase
MSKEMTIQTPPEAQGKRIDLFLAQRGPELELSRSRVQELMADGLITINGERVKASRKLQGTETIRIFIPDVKPLALNILYEDADLVVVDKPASMVVHPAPGNPDRTLVNALLHHCRDLSGIGGVERPGIVHRLDKDTSGVMVAVKTDIAHRSLSRQMKSRSVRKLYLAIVRGAVTRDAGVIEAPIGRHERHRKRMAVQTARGREARTLFEVLERFAGYDLLSLQLKTGRTHQIRVHLAHLGHPIVGDPVYGGRHFGEIGCPDTAKIQVPRQMLHARLLGFRHPRTEAFMEFEAPLPEDLQKVLQFLRENCPRH